MKCFLSHSSNDKRWFVEQVYDLLPRDQTVIDAHDFAPGAYTKEEIVEYVSICKIFVYFISEQSLESGWVQDEVKYAEEFLKSGMIKLFIPVIIDRSISFGDPRLSPWLQENYNLKYMGSPKQVAKRIKDELFYATLQLLPTLKEEYDLCLGRFKETEEFLHRFEDFQKEKLKAVVVSGLPQIGKRTFLRFVLHASQIKKPGFHPYEIIMDEGGSIEDLIAKLEPISDSIIINDLKDMLSKTMEEKKELLIRALIEISERDEIVLINDTNCLIDYTSNIPRWFSEVLEDKRIPRKLILLISSKRNLFYPKEYFYCINLAELAQKDTVSIFSRLLAIRKKDLPEDMMLFWTGLLVGHPGQIKFTVNLLERYDYNQMIAQKHSFEVVDYLNNHACVILQSLIEDVNMSNVLRFFATAEFASIELFHSIFSADRFDCLLQKLLNLCVLEFVGDNRDFLRLNGVFQDYVLRNTNRFSEEIVNKIKQLTSKCIQADEFFGDDLSASLFVATSALESDGVIDLKKLFPVHIIKAMVNIYNKRTNLSRVIHLADGLLAYRHNIANNIVEDALYYKCLSLARLQDSRVLSLIRELPDEKCTFVKGFYYRRVGRALDAIAQFETIKNKKYIGHRAKRELVLALQQLERYDEAITLARENYNQNPNNYYHVQALFKCLIYSSSLDAGNPELKKELQKLINELQSFKNQQAIEMSILASAQFNALIENNYTKAYDQATDAISQFPDSKYPLLVLMDISLHEGNYQKARNGYLMIESYLNEHKVPVRIFARQRAYYLSGIGHKNQALEVLHDELNRLDTSGKQKLLDKVEYYDIHRLK